MTVNALSLLAIDAIKVSLSIILPICLSAMIVGILVSMLQAVTQIQEITLTFVPKVIAILASVIFFMPFIASQLNTFYLDILDNIVKLP